MLSTIKKVNGKPGRYYSETQEHLEAPLTPKERSDVAHDAITLMVEIKDLENEKAERVKDIDLVIDAKKDQLLLMQGIFKTNKSLRFVDCERHIDTIKKETWIEYGGVVYGKRSLGSDELSFLGIGKKKAKSKPMPIDTGITHLNVINLKERNL